MINKTLVQSYATHFLMNLPTVETVPIKDSKEMSSAGLWQYSARYSQNQAQAHSLSVHLSSECCAEYLSPRRCEMALYITVYTDEDQSC